MVLLKHHFFTTSHSGPPGCICICICRYVYMIVYVSVYVNVEGVETGSGTYMYMYIYIFIKYILLGGISTPALNMLKARQGR